MPHTPEWLMIGAVLVIVFGAHNLRRLGDGLARLLERTFGRR